MLKKVNKNEKRKKRHLRSKAIGTPERPRLNVFRSLKHIYAQVIDDKTGKTIVSASTLDKEVAEKVNGTGNKEAARIIGKIVGERAKEKGIEAVVFDRGGYLYHGRVKELADGAREAGLRF
ncbi:50S ribosomal protein L18 [Abyssisolibacter fermentans]|uniref:50S ribosomal protein L18 n=1 Tax=Abyssisolibacter fermentans TaxID=1766203 RepID=UPI00082C82C8|nr:50S ribosomal protein L18 [Abyssisolibacter fermentans]